MITYLKKKKETSKLTKVKKNICEGKRKQNKF